MASSSYASVPEELVNRIREDERIRRLHTDALGRYNYLKQMIADKKAQAVAPNYDGAFVGYVDESIEIEGKNAELHVLSFEDTMIYYYYEHTTGSWLFMERNRVNGSSIMYSTQRRGGDSMPQVQVCST